MPRRVLVVVGLAMGLTVPVSGVSISAGATQQPASAAAPTQSFVGGGTGTADVAVHWPVWDGHYTSSGQLGRGHYQFWTYNNTATFTRSDGMTMSGPVSPLSWPRCTHDPQALCMHADVVGARDIASAHLDIALTGEANDLQPAPSAFLMRGSLTLRRRVGYAMVGANGAVNAFGGSDDLGDASETHVVDMARTPSGEGYWVVNNIGQVDAFGDAPYLGGAESGQFPSNGEVVTSISATPTGKGYWLFTTAGRALRFGDAADFGDLAGSRLNRPIVGSIATSTGKGYFMVAGDGGVFAFGDAEFHGSTGAIHLNRPVVGIVPNADNTGYWLVASDGGVFSFDAPFRGSMGSVALNRPIVTMVPYGDAYLMVAADGGAFNFSNALFFGSAGGSPTPAPIVAASAVG